MQLTLEQQGFELCVPFICIYFSVVSTTVLRGQWLLTPQMGRSLKDTGATINHNHTQINPYLVQKERKAKLLSCVQLCNPTDWSLPGSSVHGIFQLRVLEWVAITFSRGSSPTQGSNPDLLHCRHLLYRLSYKGQLYSKTSHYSSESSYSILRYKN